MSRNRSRVFITGLGAISALGATASAAWDNLIRGQSGIASDRFVLDGSSAEIFHSPCAKVNSVNVSSLAKEKCAEHAKQIDRVGEFALIATHEAITCANLLNQHELLSDAAVVYGTGCLGLRTLERGYLDILVKSKRRVHPLSVPNVMPSSSACLITMAFGIRGPSYVVSSACSSSAHAIAQGAQLIESGAANIVIVGGAEAPLTYGHMAAWRSLGALSTTDCLPFSKDRDGTVIGEGAATLILESESSASSRAAPIFGEILGSGCSSDATHITKPSIEGISRAINEAYDAAGVSKRENSLISAHGTGTILNDQVESNTLSAVFGGSIRKQTVIATKSAHGHMLGAGGAMEFLLALVALNKGLAPRTLGTAIVDPSLSIPLVTGRNREIDCDLLVSNSFAFGGMNVVLIAKKIS